MKNSIILLLSLSIISMCIFCGAQYKIKSIKWVCVFCTKEYDGINAPQFSKCSRRGQIFDIWVIKSIETEN